jgi:glycosyltransferase involved in cell wall biosynthesis
MPDGADDQRIHILFVNPRLAGGGAERVLTTLLRHIDPAKFKLTLAITDMRGEIFLKDIPDHVTVIDLKLERVRYAFAALTRLIWKLKPDIVYSALAHMNVMLAITKPLWPSGVRFIARPAGFFSEALKQIPNATRWYWLHRIFMRNVDHFIFQSRALRDDFIGKLKLGIASGTVVRNPLDIARIHKLASERIAEKAEGSPFEIVAVGRLSWEKGFDILIDAMALLRARPVHLTIFGGGDLAPELQKRIDDQGLGRHVSLAGFRPNPFPYVRQADLFVLSSRHEGFPNVVLEALACGTPVVATATHGLPEVLEGVPGCESVPIEDSIALADAIARRVGTSRIRVALDVVAAFNAPNVARLYEEVFAKVSRTDSRST